MTAHDTAAVLRALDFTPICGIGPCEHPAAKGAALTHRDHTACEALLLCNAHAAIFGHRLRALHGSALCNTHQQAITALVWHDLTRWWTP